MNTYTLLVYLIIGYLVGINLLAVGLTLYDKRAAKLRLWRTKEASLLIVSALGGSVGMLITMRVIRHKTKHKKFMVGIPIIIALQMTAVLFVTLSYFGILHFNNPNSEKYPVRGVDVSSFQGEIDWQVLSNQGIDFAYIKATEGSGFVDRYFEYNFTEALKTDLLVGAYHFFSFDSPAETQAQNIIETVPKAPNTLPIAVDVEFYGSHGKNPPSKDTVTRELHSLLETLTEHYGKKPVIYTTKSSYDAYIANDFSDYPIWHRDIVAFPNISDNRGWTFWQFSNRHRISGYNGAETYIDFNVFNGSLNELKALAEEYD